MSYEILVGLHVLDDQEYQKYREGIRPILLSYGGDFGYDFKVSEVLRSETDATINRVFTINFPDAKKMDEFFTNPDYLLVKEIHFKDSVGSTTIISSYER